MGARILIVDDEPNVLRMIGYTLHTEGYNVVIAKNGAEVLEKIKTEKPDLMILDVMMPDMSGIEVCHQLRQSSEMVDLPIIMLSAKAEVADKIKGLEVGADAYIIKPVTPEELVARVRSLLERFRQMRQGALHKKGVNLAFIGAKGGVGTTTVAINVALELIKKSVVITELRSNFGTLSAQLNCQSTKNIMEALDIDRVNTNTQKILEQLIHTQSGLTVLLGPQKCYEFREIGSVQAVAIIDTIGSVADFIVMDLPNLSSEANVKALQCCNSVGLVVEPDPICLLAGKVTKEFLFSCGVSNSQLRLVVVRRDTVDSYKLEEISTYLESDLIGVIYPAPEAFNHANITRVPVVVSNPDSLAAKSFGEIADKLSTYL